MHNTRRVKHGTGNSSHIYTSVLASFIRNKELAKKDIEIQPGFEVSLLNSGQVLLPTGPLARAGNISSSKEKPYMLSQYCVRYCVIIARLVFIDSLYVFLLKYSLLIHTFSISLTGPCLHGSVRVVNRYGTISSRGNVELCVINSWKTVCASSWDNQDASVVCRQSGYSPFG